MPASIYLNNILSNQLSSSYIFVGNSNHTASMVSMSGDATMDNTGVVTLGDTAVTSKLLTGGNFPGGFITDLDSILLAFENTDLYFSTQSSLIGGLETNAVKYTDDVAEGGILIGTGTSLIPINLTLNPISGSFALSSSGVLTFPDADLTTRGLLSSESFGVFSNNVPYSIYNSFTGSYNTGSFTGSFIGNGSNLTGIVSSSYASNASFALSASYAPSAPSNAFPYTGSADISGSLIVRGDTPLRLEYDINKYYTANLTSLGNVAFNITGALSSSYLFNTTTGSNLIFNIKQRTTTLNIGEWPGNPGWGAIFINQTTASGYTGFVLGSTGINQTYLNAATNIVFTIAGNTRLNIVNTYIELGPNTYIGQTGGAAPTARLQIKSTSEQQRIEYDASNYYKTVVGSTGIVNLTASGSGASFIFNSPVQLLGQTTSSISPTSPNRTITMVVGGTTLYIPAKTTND